MAIPTINVNNTKVRMVKINGHDFINITDIAKTENVKRPGESIRSWMRRRDTMNFLRYWEEKHNPNVNLAQLEGLWDEVGENRFQISPSEWIEVSNAIGMINKAGRTGGTYTHVNIAIHYANWLNFKFYLHFIEDYSRLKNEEANLALKQWDLRRELSKASHEIHTDAIREHLAPIIDWHTKREAPIFASEMDLLNQAVFGMTAKEFKLFKPEYKGNLRDYATTEQLEVLNGLQHLNAGLIEQGLTQGERFQILYRRARRSVDILEANKTFQQIKANFSPKIDSQIQ